MIFTNRVERTRFLRFMVVGVVGAVVDFGTFNLLTILLQVPGVWASVCSFSAAVISNFIWNRYWTYPDSRMKPVQQQVMQFIVVSLIGLGIRTPIFAGMEYLLTRLIMNAHIRLLLDPKVIAHNLALATAVIVVMFWNFFANRFWTYSDVSKVAV